MSQPDLLERLGPALGQALIAKGYETLTPVQEAVLDPAVAERNLRISSRTGSGKTVALGIAMRHAVAAPPAAGRRGQDDPARPVALVVTPTRELARQVRTELSWLFSRVPANVAVVTGGSSYRIEEALLARNPRVVVGTPGRLLEHLESGRIDGSAVQVAVLDEADRMLDLGFQEDLTAILAHLPQERTTHLVSATFPNDVLALADEVQHDPVLVQGSPPGAANPDIEHVVHLIDPNDRFAALVNLLLAAEGSPVLVFARTRADVGDLALMLGEAGFNVNALSGELDQRERDRALTAFREGRVHALVATDVAGRGLDVPGVDHVIHFQVPENSEAYTHRSGRTGRAGNQGRSAVLATPHEFRRVTSVLSQARVTFRFEPVPSRTTLREAQDQRLIERLTAEPAAEGPGRTGQRDADEPDDHARALAARLVEGGHAEVALARLLGSAIARGAAQPRDVRVIQPPTPGARRARPADGAAPYPARAPRRGHDDDGPPPRDGHGNQAWVPFRVTWGSEHGANPQRLLALLCRRGNIRGADVGAIRVARRFADVDVSADVAQGFERSASRPDPREPLVRILRAEGEQGGAPARPGPPARGPRPFRAGPPGGGPGGPGGPGAGPPPGPRRPWRS